MARVNNPARSGLSLGDDWRAAPDPPAQRYPECGKHLPQHSALLRPPRPWAIGDGVMKLNLCVSGALAYHHHLSHPIQVDRQ